jgi:molybdate transport system substrate-binding protein
MLLHVDFSLRARPERPCAMMRLLVTAIFALSLGVPALAVSAAPPAVAAASDLQYALPEITERFRQQSGQEIKLSFGSSGNFQTQIVQGAPFELFLSADEDYVYHLADWGLTLGRGVLYAKGRIVIYVPAGSAIDPTFDGLRAAFAAGRIAHFAIANPEHAPYGRAAREALQSAELWPTAQRTLVLGENVSQAAQFVFSGSAQAAIIPYSLVLAPAVAGRGKFTLISEQQHAPLRQRMVLLKKAGPTAKSFYAYLQRPEARAIFERYGFVLPAN